jgi:hypothetical protein
MDRCVCVRLCEPRLRSRRPLPGTLDTLFGIQLCTLWSFGAAFNTEVDISNGRKKERQKKKEKK